MLRAALTLFAAAAFGSGSAIASNGSSLPLPQFASDRVLVGFRSGTDRLTEVAVVTRVGAREVAIIGAETHLLEVAEGSVLDTVVALQRDPSVRYAEPDWMLMADQTPNDPLFGNQWALQNTGQTIVNGSTSFTGTPGADIKATAAWNFSVGTAWDPVANPNAPVVAIVDTGIDYQHEDLAQNVWSNPRPFSFVYTYVDGNGVTQTQTTCPTGSHGWDARAHVCDPYDPGDVPTHGSRVAGIIGAQGNNGIGVAGVNWTVQMMSVRWDDDDCLCGFTSQAIEAIDYAVQARQAWSASAGTQGANVRVMSASWGCCYPNTSRELPYDPALLDEVRKAGVAGILFVASAGNKSHTIDPPNWANMHYPCAFDNAQTFGTYDPTTATFTPDPGEQALGPATNVVCVASTNYWDQLSTFSNWGPQTVQLAAPGSAIQSTLPGNQYLFGSGTSFATPYVSGAAALLLSLEPELSVVDLKHKLVGTYAQEANPMTGCPCGYLGGAAVDQLPTLNARLSTGGGRLNVCRGINGCLPPTAVRFRSLTASATRNGVVVRWRTESENGVLGFDVYRGRAGDRIRVTSRPLLAAFGGTPHGRTYTFVDRKPARAKARQYWLRVIHLNGARTWHGPALIT